MERGLEDVGIAAEIAADARAEVGEVFREMAGIMGEGERWLGAFSFELFHVSDESTDCPGDVVVVHRRSANAWELGSIVRATSTLLCFRYVAADRATTQSASSEGESFEKTVVEFAEIFLFDEFFHGIHREIAGGTCEE